MLEAATAAVAAAKNGWYIVQILVMLQANVQTYNVDVLGGFCTTLIVIVLLGTPVF